MNVLHFVRVGLSHIVAIVDDSTDGSAKLVVMSTGDDAAVVLDFNDLVVLESLSVAGPREAARVTAELRKLMNDSDDDDAVS